MIFLAAGFVNLEKKYNKGLLTVLDKNIQISLAPQKKLQKFEEIRKF